VEALVHHEDEEVPIKLWHCDSITQAKEKILDVLYRNTPVSKRPQLMEIDLGGWVGMARVYVVNL